MQAVQCNAIAITHTSNLTHTPASSQPTPSCIATLLEACLLEAWM